MILLVGLGNPGLRYQKTRHNIGARAVQEIVHTYDPHLHWRQAFYALVSKVLIVNTKVYALRPQTFMNQSGQSVLAALQYLKLSPQQVIVFHDDMDLAESQVKVKRGGRNAGHKGLQSMDSMIGTDYWRVRLGIGHPGNKLLVESYVLGDFTPTQTVWLTPLLTSCAESFPLLLQEKYDLFVTQVTNVSKPCL